MKFMLTLLVTFFCTVEICCKVPLNNFLLGYLKFQNPKFIIFYACWTNREKLYFQTELNKLQMGVRTVFSVVDRIYFDQNNLKNYEKVSFVLDMFCENSEDILLEASLSKKFTFLQNWLLLVDSKKQTLETIEDFFKNRTAIRMDTDVKLALQNNDDYDVFEIFSPGLEVEPKLSRYGKYVAKENKFYLENYVSYYESRKNLSGVLIRSANVIHYPYKTTFHEYMVDPKLKNYDIYSKFHYQLFIGLEEIHGFHHNMTLCSSWFGNTSSGQDGGMAKMLYDGTVDVGSAGGIMRLIGSDRIDYYDYIMPYYKFRSCFFFRNPGVVKPNLSEVLKPFSPVSWYATLITSLLVCICIEIAYLVEKTMIDTGSDWIMSVFITIAVFAQQGLDRIPKNIAGRIIFFNLMIMSVLLYNYYTSSLVSSLINTEPEVFRTIRELYESNLKIGIELQSYTITYILDRSRYDYYLKMLNATKIYPDGKEIPNFLTADDGINMVKQGGFAYHTEAITAYPIIARTFEQNVICDLAEINFLNGDTSLMTGKMSQYKKLFQISLRKMWESGILRKLHLTWVGTKPECFSSARVISVGITDLFLPYFLLLLGVFFSFSVLLSEIVWRRFSHTERVSDLDNVEVFSFIN